MNNSINVLLLNEIKSIAKEKSINAEQIKEFLIDAIKRIYTKVTYEDNIRVEIDLNNGEMITNIIYVVTDPNDNEFDETIHIRMDDEKVKELGLKLGDTYEEHFEISKEFNQQQVQQIMQFFKQKITEISNQRVYESWMPMQNEVILAEIEKEDKKGGFFTINLEEQYDKSGMHLEPTLGFLGNKELNSFEVLDVRKKYPFVVLDVKEQSKFCPVILSRSSEKLVEYYMTMEIPEIDDGTVKIVKSVRQAGIKTKVLVSSRTLPVEPASVCVGPRGERVKNISKLLNGEKIEIYNYYENPYILLSQIVTKTDLVKLHVDEENKYAVLVVYDSELSKTIGKRGTNVKLASMLSGYSINVIGESDFSEYDDLKFVEVNSSEFRNMLESTKRKPNTTINESTNNVAPIQIEDFDDMMSDLDDDNELNATFQDEVKQILENEKEKL